MKDWKFAALWAFILVVIVLQFFSLLPVTPSAKPEEEEPEKKPLLPPTEPPQNVKNATLTPAPPGWDRRYGRSIVPQILGVILLLIGAVVMSFFVIQGKGGD